VFACFGVIFLTTGILLGRLLDDTAGRYAKYIAGGLLLVLGIRAIIDVFRGGYDDEGPARSLEPRAVIITGLVVSLDKLAVGLALAVADVRIAPVIVYLAIQGAVATWIGLALGTRLGTRLGDYAHLAAGLVFTALGALIVFQTATDRSLL
jgi:putative Mn2+ efflux pump MntP